MSIKQENNIVTVEERVQAEDALTGLEKLKEKYNVPGKAELIFIDTAELEDEWLIKFTVKLPSDEADNFGENNNG